MPAPLAALRLLPDNRPPARRPPRHRMERSTEESRQRSAGGRSMPEKPDHNPAEDGLPTFELPSPRRELVPLRGDPPEVEKTYFDPEKWEQGQWRPCEHKASDPVARGIGRQEGRARAALIVSDFHAGDGSVSGDDFLDDHLHRDKDL